MQPSETLFSLEAEESVLGGLMLEPERLDTLEGVVDEAFFHRPGHRVIYRAIRRVLDAGDRVDPITVLTALRNAGEDKQAGGAAYLARLESSVPTAANIEYHARILRDKAHLRKLESIGREIVALVSTGKPAAEVQEQVERWVYAAGEGVQVDAPIQHIKVGLQAALEAMERNDADVLTGFADYDRMSHGFARGDLIILAARPSMGKTAFALQAAVNVARREQKPVPVFSLEMSQTAISRRMMFCEGRVDGVKFRSKPQQDDYARLAQAVANLHKLPLHTHCTARTVREMRAQCRRVVSSGGPLGMVVIDYLGKMRGSGRAEKRVHELGEITGDLKALAVEFDCPVLCLAQLSRAVEARPDKRPMMSDLRDSGEIEQDADTVLLLYRPEYYFGPTMKIGEGKMRQVLNVEGMAELIVGKQRNGETGTVHLAFLKQFTRFEDLATREDR